MSLSVINRGVIYSWEEWSRALDSMVDDRIEVEIRKSVLFQFGTSAETKGTLLFNFI
jgi:hypothetical protein